MGLWKSNFYRSENIARFSTLSLTLAHSYGFSPKKTQIHAQHSLSKPGLFFFVCLLVHFGAWM